VNFMFVRQEQGIMMFCFFCRRIWGGTATKACETREIFECTKLVRRSVVQSLRQHNFKPKE
jgi:hypothetical protein